MEAGELRVGDRVRIVERQHMYSGRVGEIVEFSQLRGRTMTFTRLRLEEEGAIGDHFCFAQLHQVKRA